MRGSREYIEIEGNNCKFESIRERLKEASFEDLSKYNSSILLNFLEDLEKGKYTSKNSPNGKRSYKRLVKLFYVVKKLSILLGGKDLTSIKEKELEKVFDDINCDNIRRQDGRPYKDKRDFRKDFTTFWHWHMLKTYKTNGLRLDDITEYITTSKESKPKFVFFTLEELKEKILQHTSNEDLKAILLILFDCGARPSEFYNIRRSDVTYSEIDKKYMVEIPEETSKTFGRKIKLWISSNTLHRYLQRHNFSDNDLIFIGKKNYMKVFLWELRKKSDIAKITHVGKNITMYDFRHSSACYYLNRYPTAKDMKYRYGWKKESEIEYYTAFLGKQDYLSEEELLSPEDKTKLEKELDAQKKANRIMEDRLLRLENMFLKKAVRLSNESIEGEAE